MDNNNRFFHGKVSRENATRILLSNSSSRTRDGHFLVRESLRSPGYVLSVVFKGTVFHFQIASREDGLLRIDDGPLFKSLELVIGHYRITADGLPCQLGTTASGGVPPPFHDIRPASDRGPTIHQAAREGNVPLIHRHLTERPQDVNCRDMNGSTPLLEAVRCGQESAVNTLLSFRADPALKDSGGNIALKVGSHSC